jgi:hypothetical protein
MQMKWIEPAMLNAATVKLSGGNVEDWRRLAGSLHRARMDMVDAIARRDSAQAIQLVRDYRRKVVKRIRRISVSETATIRAAPRRLMSSASESTQAVHFVAQPPNPHQFSRWIEPWAWEKPNTLARYYVCTEGVAVSQI